MKISVSEKIVNSLISTGAVPQDDKDLYEYGIRQGIVLVINILTAVLIGLALGMVWQSVVFLIVYYPTRSYAGGYHTNSPLTCYLFSIPLMLFVLLGIKMPSWSGYTIILALVLAVAIVVYFAPVEDAHKPLDQLEKKVYKRKTCINMAVLSCFVIVFLLLDARQLALCFMMAALMVSIMLILGVLKNRRKGKVKA